MQSSSLYIPKQLKVGFQKREDCFTKCLAYLIYRDDTGKLRKETSWESWRDKTIAPLDLSNDPITDLTINKDIKRYNWSHFSSNRTMIRVHDPRGFEFEITTENLIGVLMNTDCLKRGLQGSFVYAWAGKELVLLPTNCEEYINATKYTSLQAKKVKSKELVPGASYITKKQETVVYLGKFDWWKLKSDNIYKEGVDVKEWSSVKHHIFAQKVNRWQYKDGKSYQTQEWEVTPRSSLTFIAEQTSVAEVSEYPELLQLFHSSSYSSKVESVEAIDLVDLYAENLFTVNQAAKNTWDRIKVNQESFFLNKGDRIYKMNRCGGSYFDDKVGYKTDTEISLNPLKIISKTRSQYNNHYYKETPSLQCSAKNTETYPSCNLKFNFKNGTTKIVTANNFPNFLYELT